MTITTVRAVMTRRILINFRVDPEPLARLLPQGLQPKLVNGWGLGGVCLIRLEQLRPAFLPPTFGVSSENAAHRVAVEWRGDDGLHQGVFIPRRDTSSLLNRFAGGRLFPGVHHLARITSRETVDAFDVDLRSNDHITRVKVRARCTPEWPAGSVFHSLEDASAFLQSGCCGLSYCANGRSVEQVRLQTDHWEMQALAVDEVVSSFFDERNRFPAGTVNFDSALLMRGIPHSWHAIPTEETLKGGAP